MVRERSGGLYSGYGKKYDCYVMGRRRKTEASGDTVQTKPLPPIKGTAALPLITSQIWGMLNSKNKKLTQFPYCP